MGFQRVRHGWMTNTNLMDMSLNKFWEMVDGRSGVLPFMGSQRAEHDLAAEQQQQPLWAKPSVRRVRNVESRCLLSRRPFSSGEKIKEPWSKRRATSLEKEGETVPLWKEAPFRVGIWVTQTLVLSWTPSHSLAVHSFLIDDYLSM